MKNIFIKLLVATVLFFGLTAASNAEPNKFGIKANANYGAYRSSIGSVSSTADLDSMLGVGLVLKIPMQNDWDILIEGQYNTQTGFTNSLATKTNITAYPIELNAQKNFGIWYLLGGLNYSLWTMNAGATTFSMQNGLGGQMAVGWNNVLMQNMDIELKYHYLTASTDISGTVVNTALGIISLGTKIWI